MHSKTSKHQKRPSPWKAESDCSENQLITLASELAQELRLGDRVLLEGPMGVGKTTFARALLQGLGVEQPPEGSPSFAIAHEYQCPQGGVAHLDFYRMKVESEIDDTGIPAYYWERSLIVISEWLSSWPQFREQVLKSGRIWEVTLAYSEADSGISSPGRQITITRLSLSR